MISIHQIPRPFPLIRKRAVAACVVVLLAIGAVAARAAETSAPSDTVFRPGITMSVGWAMGLSFDAFDPTRDVAGAEKLDLAPFIHLSAEFGNERQVSTEFKIILANFARLVNQENVEEFGEQSGTSVRRALITDFTVRTPTLARWNESTGLLWNIVNLGFNMDTQDDNGSSTIDAASYLFTGPTIYGHFGGHTYAMGDILVGTSELLTGVESFDFDRHKKYPVRVRPRAWLHFQVADKRPIDFGFWGDLGVSDHSPDAVTAYIATTVFGPR